MASYPSELMLLNTALDELLGRSCCGSANPVSQPPYVSIPPNLDWESFAGLALQQGVTSLVAASSLITQENFPADLAQAFQTFRQAKTEENSVRTEAFINDALVFH